MYVPVFNGMSDDEARALVAGVGAAELITTGPDGFPCATRLPTVWRGDQLIFHMAFANPHWRSIEPGAPALAIVTGPEAYISPTWYPSKAEHHRVVPTWNYSAVHFKGTVSVHRDPEWLAGVVSELTDAHESHRSRPWSIDDAPETYIEQQLRAIVGVELAITSVEAKAKRSQNRSDGDRSGVIQGLISEPIGPSHALAEQMRSDLES